MHSYIHTYNYIHIIQMYIHTFIHGHTYTQSDRQTDSSHLVLKFKRLTADAHNKKKNDALNYKIKQYVWAACRQKCNFYEHRAQSVATAALSYYTAAATLTAKCVYDD